MKLGRLLLLVLSLALLIVLIVTFVNQKEEQKAPDISVSQPSDTNVNEETTDNVSDIDENLTNIPENSDEDVEEPSHSPDPDQESTPTATPNIEPDTDAKSVSVIVNPDYKLPDNYEPDDLVYPDVRFIFEEKIEKRMLRQEAAEALEHMFEAAEVDGIYLAGVSAYRSHSTQTALFNRYVERDGYEKAKTYSAEPGTSEHETGLAIDVTSSDGKCAAQDCFGGTAEAIWLENNAAAYGFIIRYPEGKQEITGYKYEPWHLRYVGVELAKHIDEEDLTLEEYYQVSPVKR